MLLALSQNYVEAAKILASKGADCTEREKAFLQDIYTNFQQMWQREQEEDNKG